MTAHLIPEKHLPPVGTRRPSHQYSGWHFAISVVMVEDYLIPVGICRNSSVLIVVWKRQQICGSEPQKAYAERFTIRL